MRVDSSTSVSLVDLFKEKVTSSKEAPVVSGNSAAAAAFASMVSEMAGNGIESAVTGLADESSQAGDSTASVTSVNLSIDSQSSEKDLFRLLEAGGQQGGIGSAGEDGRSFYEALRANPSANDNGESGGEFASYMQRMVNNAYSQ